MKLPNNVSIGIGGQTFRNEIPDYLADSLNIRHLSEVADNEAAAEKNEEAYNRELNAKVEEDRERLRKKMRELNMRYVSPDTTAPASTETTVPEKKKGSKK